MMRFYHEKLHVFNIFINNNSVALVFLFHFFFLSGFSFTDTDDSQRKEWNDILFYSFTFTRSLIFRHLFATLHVRCLKRIFNHSTCIYRTATRWDLRPYWITIWLIDWWCDVCLFVCLLDDLIRDFLLQQFDTGNQWIWTRINYHLNFIWFGNCNFIP